MDRLAALRAQSRVTAIDFVFVAPGQTELDVYFHDPQPGALLPQALKGDVTAAQITIASTDGGDTLPVVPVTNVAWQVKSGRDVLVVTTGEPGDFSLYTFTLADPRVDPFYNGVTFSFKAGCPSQLDCAPPEHVCAPDTVVDVPVDYLARDFESLRSALLDFAAARYPAWKDRLEADAGVMFVELLSAVGDEMAYYQDRVGRESALEGASERRSIRRHARLVDYELDDGRAATTWIDVTCHVAQAGAIPAGTAIADVLPATGAEPQRWFEIGRGLDDTLAAVTFAVSAACNAFAPHVWDDSAACLPPGATSLHVQGHHVADITFDDLPPGAAPGKWMLLRTSPADPAIAPRAWLVRVIERTDLLDPVGNVPITLLRWDQAQATPFELDLTVLAVRGNLVPACAGRRHTSTFTIGPSTDPAAPAAVARIGHDGTRTYLATLPGSEAAPLAWLPSPYGAERGAAFRKPEIVLIERGAASWPWRRALLGRNSVAPADQVFTLEDGSWRRVVGFRRSDGEFAFRDYANGEGFTIRFGDDQFGRTPPEGLVFDVTYRLAHGADDNAGATTLRHLLAPLLDPVVASVTNPLPILDGADAEPNDRVRRLAPYSYQNVTYRAVTPDDYAAAAETLSWVAQAGAAVRWTGSWPTVFVTPDPRGTFGAAHRSELEQQLDRYRQTGREVDVADPVYANVDLRISVCVGPGTLHVDAHAAAREDVEAEILRALFGTTGIRATAGFFAHDRFTFGTPLLRSALEATIQAVPGVIAVEDISIRRRGRHDWRAFDELVYAVGVNEMIRIANDRNLPERGSVQVLLEVSA